MNDKKELMNINGNSITAIDVMDAVDTVLEVLWQTGNLENAIKASNSLGMIEDISGKAKAKLWFGWKQWWDETGQGDIRNDVFEDMMESETGNKAVTVTRYVNVWKYIDNVTIPKDVQERPMRDLIPIASALSQGYDFEKDEWKKLARASNSSEVLEIIRIKKGKLPRKSGITGELSRDGSLYAWQDGKKTFAGYLELKSENQSVQKLIRRIIDGAGLQEK